MNVKYNEKVKIFNWRYWIYLYNESCNKNKER